MADDNINDLANSDTEQGPANKELRISTDNKSMNEEEKEESNRICNLYTCALRSELDNLVKNKDPEALKALVKLFPATKYPDLQKTEHCFYCCRKFDPRDLRRKCSIEHEIDDCHRDYKGSHGSEWSATCRRCGEEFSGSSDYRDEPPEDLGEGYCYKGPHDSSDEAFEEVFGWHTEEHGKYEPFDDCDICEAKRVEYLRSKGEDEDGPTSRPIY